MWGAIEASETVQDRVGAWFGITGGLVVAIVIVVVLVAADAAGKRKDAGQTTRPMTQVCANGEHHRCPGVYRTTDGFEGPCSCTCHLKRVDSAVG